jgi:hypothetical protein
MSNPTGTGEDGPSEAVYLAAAHAHDAGHHALRRSTSWYVEQGDQQRARSPIFRAAVEAVWDAAVAHERAKVAARTEHIIRAMIAGPDEVPYDRA